AGATWADAPVAITALKWRADGVSGIGARPLGFSHLFVVPVTGGAPRQITTGDFDHGGEPAWMPDGKSIGLDAAPPPDAHTTLYPSDIWRFQLDEDKPTRLTSMEGTENGPIVSPDGRYIAFTGFPDKGNAFHNTNLYVMNADGSNVRQLAKELDRN